MPTSYSFSPQVGWTGFVVRNCILFLLLAASSGLTLAQCPDTPCAEGSFCDFDSGTTGVCQNCSTCPSCFSCGLLAAAGASACHAACNPRCPENMFAPPDSGQDSFNDCTCVEGATTRRFDLEGCTFYQLQREEGCGQNGLSWQNLGKADRPADCMQLLLDDATLCTRKDFFLWKEPGDQSCHCPGGTFSGGVGECDYDNPREGESFDMLRLMAFTYVVRGTGTSCFNLNYSLCDLCEAGKYANETDRGFNTASCALCPAGTYSDVEGANSSSTCIPCGAGRYSEDGGQTTNSTCLPCPAGKFSPLALATACLSCGAGSYSERSAAISNSTCLQVTCIVLSVISMTASCVAIAILLMQLDLQSNIMTFARLDPQSLISPVFCCHSVPQEHTMRRRAHQI